MAEMVECLSRRIWLSNGQMLAVLSAFNDEVRTDAICTVMHIRANQLKSRDLLWV